MNERIEKLSKQARQYAWENETHWSANAEREALFEQKFAELIVRECSNFLKDTLDDHFAAEQLEEHFGVGK
jgi:hypothetical protein